MPIINDSEKSLGLVSDSNLKGKVDLYFKDKDGNTVNEHHVHNMIVNTIRKPIVALLGGWNAAAVADLPCIYTLNVGTGDTAPDVSQTALVSPVADGKGQINTTSAPQFVNDGLAVTFSFLYEMNSGIDNIAIHEMGLYTRSGVMVARTNVGTFTKSKNVYLEVYWTIGYSE